MPSRAHAGQGTALTMEEESAVILVDCGPGIRTRFIESGFDHEALTHIYLTHLHYDHCVDLGSLILTAWVVGKKSINVIGPPGTKKMVDALFSEVYDKDIEHRNLFRAPFIEVLVEEIGHDWTGEEDGWNVRAVEVAHMTNSMCLAYRFDSTTDGSSVTISGDTNFNENLCALAENSDILIHEAAKFPLELAPPELRQSGSDLRKFLEVCLHSSAEDAGKLAALSKAKTLIITHYNHLLNVMDENLIVEKAGNFFDGKIVLAHDLHELTV